MRQRTIFEIGDTGPADEHFEHKTLVTLDNIGPAIRSLTNAPELVCDTETTGLYPHRGARIFSVQFLSGSAEHPWVFDARVIPRKLVIAAVAEIFEARAVNNKPIIFHNAKFDIKLLLADGIVVPNNVHCTKELAFILDENRKVNGKRPKRQWSGTSLNNLCIELGAPKQDQKQGDAIQAWFRMRGMKDKRYDKLPLSLIVPYAGQDVIATLWLWRSLKAELDRQTSQDPQPGRTLSDLYNNARKLPYHLARTEMRGLPIDLEFLNKAERQLTIEVEQRVLSLVKKYGLQDPGSGQAIHDSLVNLGVLWPEWARNEQGDPLTGHEVLDHIDHPAAKAVLEWRERDKLLNTYIIPWCRTHQVDGVLYGNFHQNGARTSRMAADDPNLQNVPVRSTLGKWVRKAFITRPCYDNYFNDYSQIEFREFTHYSGDAKLIAGYCDSPDFDCHQMVADQLGLDRTEGKHTNFGMLYGMGIEKFAVRMGCSIKEAKKYRQRYKAQFPGIQTLADSIKRSIRTRGYVRDVFGARQRFDGTKEHAFLNYLIQGSAAQSIKHAIPGIEEVLAKHGGHTLAYIHDEVEYELPSGIDVTVCLKEMKEVMEDFGDLFKVPILVDTEFTKTSWADKKEIQV